ncbi:MAG: hypothetical protein RBS21_01350 [Corynebacterium sp.]|nr:hypothetical protein [Corynebacterium sp.]
MTYAAADRSAASAQEHLMSTSVLVIAMIAIAVFIVGFAVVARMFIGRLKGEDEEIVRAREEGREPDEDNIPRR